MRPDVDEHGEQWCTGGAAAWCAVVVILLAFIPLVTLTFWGVVAWLRR